MRIYAMDTETNKAIRIDIPASLRDAYILQFAATTPAKKSVVQWLWNNNAVLEPEWNGTHYATIKTKNE